MLGPAKKKGHRKDIAEVQTPNPEHQEGDLDWVGLD